MKRELKQQYNEMLKTMQEVKSITDYQIAYCAVNRVYERLAILLRREFMRAIVNNSSLKVSHVKRVVKACNKELQLTDDMTFKYHLGDRDFSYNVSLGCVDNTYPYLLPGYSASTYCYFCTIGWGNDFPRDVWKKELAALDNLEVITAEQAIKDAKEANEALAEMKTAIKSLLTRFESSKTRDMFTKQSYIDISYPYAGSEIYLSVYQASTIKGGIK